MAIAFDTSTNGGLANPGTSLSWSHTCAGSDRILFVAVRSTTSTTDNVTGVTYNGASLTLVDRRNGDAGLLRAVSLWVLAGPASGANTIQVSGSPSDVILGLAASYTGAGASPPDATNQGTALGSASVQVAVSPVASGCWIVGMEGNNVGVVTVTNATERQDSANGINLSDTNGTVTAGASYQITWTNTAGERAAIVASFAPAGASTPTVVFATSRRAMHHYRRDIFRRRMV